MHNGITTNVFQRTFYIGYKGNTGSSFSIEIDDREYLITAKHIVEDFPPGDSIEIFHNQSWISVRPRLAGHAPMDADISVFVLPSRLVGSDLTLPAKTEGIWYGQNVYFCGFPYGMFQDLGAMNNNYPAPFVKKGIISNLQHTEIGLHRLYIDGINNIGFSGGPVVVETAPWEFQVIGAVSGYVIDEMPVEGPGPGKLTFTVSGNSGLIDVTSIDYAVRIAKIDGGGQLWNHSATPPPPANP